MKAALDVEGEVKVEVARDTNTSANSAFINWRAYIEASFWTC